MDLNIHDFDEVSKYYLCFRSLLPGSILAIFCVSVSAILFPKMLFTCLIIVQSIFSVPKKLLLKCVCVTDSGNDFKILLIKQLLLLNFSN